jgi:hypothetical protein
MPQRHASSIATGLALALATAAFALWQATHVAILWDLSYLLDSSYRLTLGQVPYRDFPFVHAPLTFVVQSVILRLAGRAYWHHAVYTALAAAVSTLLAWRIVQRLHRNKTLALLLTLPLVTLSIYGIYPHPEYDSDAILAVLFALYLLQRLTPTTPTVLCLLTGAALIPPVFYKQNIGLFFLAASIGVLLALIYHHQRNHAPIRSELLVLTGAISTLALALLTIHVTAGLRNYYHWTITFAAQRRLPGLGLMLSTYHQTSLLWTVPSTVIALLLLHYKPNRWSDRLALLLLSAPFLYAVLTLPLLDDASDRADQLLSLWPHLLILSIALSIFNLIRRPFTLRNLLPLILLATIHGTFLSQQLWGSTYALWPLLMLLLACMLPLVPRITAPLTAIASLTLLLCGTAYAISHERLNYVYLDGPLTPSTSPALKGLATPGPWLPQLDALVRDTNATIPATDTLLLYPGQDPFYYATGRTPRLPVLLFDPSTDPYTPAQLTQSVVDKNVRWLILSRNLQLTAYAESNYADYLAALQPLFVLDHQLANYDIYRRR